MGRGIAHAAALGGYRTILEDILPSRLRKAENEIRANLDQAVELGKVTAGGRQCGFRSSGICGIGRSSGPRRRSRHRSRSRGDGIEDRDLHPARQNLPPGTILASNTSSLSITEIASRHLSRAEVRRHALLQSSAQNEAAGSRARARDRRRHAGTAVEVGRRMKKEVVVIKESPGLHHQPHQRHDRQRGVSTCCRKVSPPPKTSTKR